MVFVRHLQRRNGLRWLNVRCACTSPIASPQIRGPGPHRRLHLIPATSRTERAGTTGACLGTRLKLQTNTSTASSPPFPSSHSRFGIQANFKFVVAHTPLYCFASSLRSPISSSLFRKLSSIFSAALSFIPGKRSTTAKFLALQAILWRQRLESVVRLRHVKVSQ